ncbi:T9SS type A sorting domain-containing protein [Algibacter miyuki]|uniref:T9SS type A sorting domain-containing protein n=1 Tax=Algibacter miyuki TaxID=1306933 RepID=A0ABV5GWM1_9FLAO|nr:T9SS type A sorting domain-containing protein [Algibacter miyuki]MDN3664270.1 T9SS type A sorting domain-containing protein [Algibacter miyuki]
MYPNPSSDFLNISGLTETQHYGIYNIIGTEVKKGSISNQEKIDIQDLTNGIYLLKLDTWKHL